MFLVWYYFRNVLHYAAAEAPAGESVGATPPTKRARMVTSYPLAGDFQDSPLLALACGSHRDAALSFCSISSLALFADCMRAFWDCGVGPSHSSCMTFTCHLLLQFAFALPEIVGM